MFGLKLKKRDKTEKLPEKTEIKVENAAETYKEEQESITVPAALEKETLIVPKTDTLPEKTEKETSLKKETTEFSRFANILSKSEDEIIEECKLFQIRNVMAKLSKAVVRRGVRVGEVGTLIENAVKSGLSEIAAAPSYIDVISKAIKGEEEIKVSAVVDFPFGESSFKVRFSEIKNAVKKGVDGVLTVINTAALIKENGKILKKELRKIGKLKAVERGAAVNAEDAKTDDLKQIIRLSEKTGINYVAFMFGAISETELVAKMKEINSFKCKLPVKVMANVNNVEGVKTLLSLKVSGIITPYADDIARELFKEFEIKSVKLGK